MWLNINGYYDYTQYDFMLYITEVIASRASLGDVPELWKLACLPVPVTSTLQSAAVALTRSLSSP